MVLYLFQFPVNGLDLSPYVVTDSNSGVVEGEHLGGSKMAPEDINQRHEPPRDHTQNIAQGDVSSPTMAARTGAGVHGSVESVQGGFVSGDRHDASRPNGSTKMTEAASAGVTMTSLGDGRERGATKAAQASGKRGYTPDGAAALGERSVEPVVLGGKRKDPSSADNGAVEGTDSALSHGGNGHDDELSGPGMSPAGVIGANVRFTE